MMRSLFLLCDLMETENESHFMFYCPLCDELKEGPRSMMASISANFTHALHDGMLSRVYRQWTNTLLMLHVWEICPERFLTNERTVCFVELLPCEHKQTEGQMQHKTSSSKRLKSGSHWIYC